MILVNNSLEQVAFVKKTLKYALIGGFILLLYFLPKKNNVYSVLVGNTMGTTYTIKYSESNIDQNSIQGSINGILDDINKQMSTYDSNSEISTFNATPEDSLILVSDDFYHVLVKSKYYYDISNGQFDVTVDNLSSIWGFGETDFIKPLIEVIDSVLDITGFDKIDLLGENIISKKNSKVKINLNAIAKGYALDKISKYFDDSNINDYMIEIGGEVKVKGKNSKGTKWTIAISSPNNGTKDYLDLIYLNNGSMATSGDYRNFIIHDTTSYSHIINPVTGYPAANNVVSATVISEDCIDADALATILNVMHVSEGVKLINNLDAVECFIVVSDKGEINYYYSNNMKDYFNQDY